MKKFKINWSETLYYENIVEAKNASEAEDKFNSLDPKELNVVSSTGGEDLDVVAIHDVCNEEEDADGNCGCTNKDTA